MEWSLPAAFDVVAAAAPERLVLVWKDVRRTHAEVVSRTRALAAFLRRHGIGVRRERDGLEGWECGQAPVALLLYNCPEYIEAMLGAFRARAGANLFGMTESGGPYCATRLDLEMPADKHGSCGRPFDGIEVWIVDPTTGAAVPPGVDGEIRLRGPSPMRAICGRTRPEVFDAAGWYATGDVGRLDHDGYLWFSSRLDDMVKIKRATVYPTEVEAALRAVPGVAPAFVTDVAASSGAREIAALVVSRVERDELATAVRTRSSAFKVPTRWLVLPDGSRVPMSPTGKVVKEALQQLLAAHARPATA